MKLCPCGGIYYRHGATLKGGQRYICKQCRRSITVQDGNRVEGRKMIKDWRHAD